LARILLIEDDRRIADFVRRGLQAEGHVVEWACSGPEGLQAARDGDFSLIVLDLNLPGLDGVEICRVLRSEGSAALVLMLTARDALPEKLAGLRAGADDYLTKPFAFDELVARVEALLRRPPVLAEAESVLQVGDLTLYLKTKRARRGDREAPLTAREFALLEYLMRHRGVVLSRARLLSNVWGYSFDPGTKVLDVCIAYLRRKLDGPGEASVIRTVRGFGYQIAEGTGP
jgi:two-component system, OmpR family, response regulator